MIFETMPDGNVAADVPEFLEVVFGRALGDLDPERRVAALAAPYRFILRFHFDGQRKKLLRQVPGAGDQIGIDPMIGDDGKAEALETAAEILCEALRVMGLHIQRNRPDGFKSHAHARDLMRAEPECHPCALPTVKRRP